MKSSMLLLETIISFFIMSMVFYFSTVLYSNIIQAHKEEFEHTLSQSDLFASKLFIAQQLKNGQIKEIHSNKIDFYAFDTQAFLQGLYSGIAVLDKSSSSKVYTLNSQITKLKSTLILFNNTYLYELNKSHENDVLYLEDLSKKIIYEHYKIVKNISTISFLDNSLYFNNNLLQNNITKFNATNDYDDNNNKTLLIDICIKNNCQKWIF